MFKSKLKLTIWETRSVEYTTFNYSWNVLIAIAYFSLFVDFIYNITQHHNKQRIFAKYNNAQQKQPRLQPLFWNIFRAFPLLFVHLYAGFPDRKKCQMELNVKET